MIPEQGTAIVEGKRGKDGEKIKRGKGRCSFSPKSPQYIYSTISNSKQGSVTKQPSKLKIANKYRKKEKKLEKWHHFSWNFPGPLHI
jgi:hypothetical protein